MLVACRLAGLSLGAHYPGPPALASSSAAMRSTYCRLTSVHPVIVGVYEELVHGALPSLASTGPALGWDCMKRRMPRRALGAPHQP